LARYAEMVGRTGGYLGEAAHELRRPRICDAQRR
jgi:hypothetical protein